MRRLTLIVIVLVGLYSAYWFVGSSATQRAAAAQLNDLSNAGWTVDYADLDTAGYPSRFDTTLTDLRMIGPDGRAAWAIPFVQALSLSYKPNDVILAFANTQNITVNAVPLAITSTGLRARVTLTPTPALGLNALTAETGPMAIVIAGDDEVTLSNAVSALRLAGPAPYQYDAYLDIDAFRLPNKMRRTLDPSGILPDSFDQITMDAAVIFDRAIDHTTPTQLPRPVSVSLRGMTLVWGPLQLRATGDITVDRFGTPTGKITLTAQNWREMVTMAAAAGVLDTRVAQTVQSMAGLLFGTGSEISAPVTFQNGAMALGPIPLGAAPKFF